MRLLVTGSREIITPARIFGPLDALHRRHRISCVIHGGARGADQLAAEWAVKNGVKCRVFYPDYALYNPRQAPLVRNTTMVEKGAADWCYAFLVDGLPNRGTLHCAKRAREHGLPTFQFTGEA